MNLSTPHVTLVIANWNRKQHTLECLESVAGIDYPSYSIVVVDNGSTDGSPEAIERWSCSNKPVSLIRHAENMGFVKGSNVGIRHALKTATEYFFLLNNDTIVNPDALTKLVATAEHAEHVGMVGPKIYQHGKNNVLDSAGTRTIPWLAQGFLVGHGEEDRGQHDNPSDMPYITGTALLISRAVIEKVGLMDEVYFHFFDDFDWGYRARKAGFRLAFVPAAVIHHKGSKTAGLGSPFYMRHMARSRVLFARKHVSFFPFLIAFMPYLILYRFLRPIVILLVHRKWSHLRALHRGLKEGFTTPITSKTG